MTFASAICTEFDRSLIRRYHRKSHSQTWVLVLAMIVRPYNRPVLPTSVHGVPYQFRRQSWQYRSLRTRPICRTRKSLSRKFVHVTLPSRYHVLPRNNDLRCNGHSEIPEARGLYNPENDKDSCGVGFIGELTKRPSRRCIEDAIEMLRRMTHRGACGCEENTGTALFINS